MMKQIRTSNGKIIKRVNRLLVRTNHSCLNHYCKNRYHGRILIKRKRKLNQIVSRKKLKTILSQINVLKY